MKNYGTYNYMCVKLDIYYIYVYVCVYIYGYLGLEGG